jgi:hypothetical protein
MRTASLLTMMPRHASSPRATFVRGALTALAAAALAACGGGGSSETPNEAPTVALGAPAAGATVVWGQPVGITATAADTDGTIARVEFYDGADKIGEDTTAPYEFTWANAPAGTRVITARAIDNAGGSTVSAGRTLVISNQAPTVSVTSPAPDAAVAAGRSVKITATAADTEGPVARVEFYDGANKLGESTTAPFEFTWTNPPTGTHTLTARAIDGAGAATASAAQTLVVTDVEGPWASLGAALQGGITAAPSRAIEAGGLDAFEVLSVVGINKQAPVWRAAMAQAAKSMATANFTPAGGFLDCAGGGRMIVAPGAGTRRLVSFDNCVLGGFTFYGGVNVAPYSHTSVTGATPGTIQIGSTVDWDPTANGFTLTINGVRVTGNGAPDAGTGDYPRNAIGVTTTVTCTGTGAGMSCLTTYLTGYNWGTDFVWDSFAAGPLAGAAAGPLYATDDVFRVNGTYRASFGGGTQRNIRFEDFTQTSGRAIVYGSNGWSVVTRLAPLSPGVEQVQVKRTLTAAVTVGAVTYPVGPGPTERYRCEVGAAAEWECTLIVAP